MNCPNFMSPPRYFSSEPWFIESRGHRDRTLSCRGELWLKRGKLPREVSTFLDPDIQSLHERGPMCVEC